MITFILNGVEIPEVEAEIAATLQSFSFFELGSRKGSFSNTFELPKTNEIRQALESLELVTSATDIPYQRNTCQIYKDGILIIDGSAVIVEVSEVYRLFISAGNSDFFKSLSGLKLQDVNLIDYDHAWNFSNIIQKREAVEGFVYPNIDYGFFEYRDPEALYDLLTDFVFFNPSFWAKTILRRAISNLGYTLQGDLLTSSAFNNLAVLCKAPKADLTDSLAQYRQTIEFGQLTEMVAQKISFSEKVNDRGNLYTINNAAGQFTYRPNIELSADAVFEISFTGKVITNDPFSFQNTRFYVDLLIYNAAGTLLLTLSRDVRFEDRRFGLFNIYRAPDNGLLERELNFTYPSTTTDVTNFNALIAATADLTTLRFGWQVREEVPNRGLNRIKLENAEFTINQVPLDTSRLGGPPIIIRAANVLPASPSVADLLLLVANLEGILIQVDETTKVVQTSRLDSIINRLGEAEDWSDKLDLTQEPTISFQIEGLAQKNFFQFAGDDDDPFLPDNLGRGTVEVNDLNLEAERVLFETPFSPVVVLPSFQGTRTMGRVFTGEKYTFDGFEFILNEPLVVEDFAPRVAMLSAGASTVDIIAGLNTINFEVNPGALDFSRALANNWRLLNAVIDRGKVVKALFLLDLEDVRNVDFTRPVYVDYFGAFFFKQRIEQFKINQRESCFVTLIKISA